MSVTLRLRLCPLSIAVLFVAASAVAQTPSAMEKTPVERSAAAHDEIPPALTHYLGREIAQTMHYTAPRGWCANGGSEEECSRMLQELNIKPGQTVCDMGCGNGFYTLKLAELVGDTGQVCGPSIFNRKCCTCSMNRTKRPSARILNPC